MNKPRIPAKVRRPKLLNVLQRSRLFKRLDAACQQPFVWITAPPGAGKTSLVSSYLEQGGLAGLWYQVDERDADPATFFHYLGLAARHAAPRYRKPLPHLTPEYLPGLPVFARNWFEELYNRLKPPCALVFDNYHEVPAEAALHELLNIAQSSLPAGACILVLSREEPPPALARARAGGAMAYVTWEDLKLTVGEAAAMVQLRGQQLGQTALIRLHDQT